MDKIKMTTPLVEMDGDEMTRVLWKMIKDELILPFVELKTEYYSRMFDELFGDDVAAARADTE